jgi:nucleoporin NUP82
MTTTYDEQSQFLQGLRRQASAHVGKSSHPNGIREAVIRGRHSTDKTAAIQGPFLLQPSPLELDTDGGAATDIIYMTRHDVEGSIAGGTVHIVAIAYQDGKVDICLDVIKVEPRWESGLKTNRSIPNVDELPILLVFETIDLGIENLSEALIEANFPQLLGDAVNPEAFYVFHIAGIHVISMSPWIPTIRTALSREPQLLISGLKDSKHSEVGKVWSSEASERCALIA